MSDHLKSVMSYVEASAGTRSKDLEANFAYLREAIRYLVKHLEDARETGLRRLLPCDPPHETPICNHSPSERVAFHPNLCPDWTAEGYRTNSSETFKFLENEVASVIRGSAHHLIGGRAESVAGIILAVLAHKWGLAPTRATEKAIEAAEKEAG